MSSTRCGHHLALVYTHRRVYLATLSTGLSVLLLPADLLLHGAQQAGHAGAHGGLLGVVVDDLSVLSILNGSLVSLILGGFLTLGRLSLTTNKRFMSKLAPMEFRFAGLE